MGVEYRHQVHPIDEEHRPTVAALVRLVDRMRAGRRLPRGDDEASRHLRDMEVTADSMCALRRRAPTKREPAGWSWMRLPHVITEAWIDAQPRPFDLTWHISGDFTGEGPAWLRHPLTPSVDEEPYYTLTLTLVDALDVDALDDEDLWQAELPGFSLIVDCGKCFPREAGEIKLHPSLRALVEAEIGARLEEAGEYY